MQGAGWLTNEELVWDSEGTIAHAFARHLQDSRDRRYARHFQYRVSVEATQSNVIHGSKAVGEPPLMLAISVREAIRDAVAAFGNSRRRNFARLHRPHAKRSSTPSHGQLKFATVCSKRRRNMPRRSRSYSERTAAQTQRRARRRAGGVALQERATRQRASAAKFMMRTSRSMTDASSASVITKRKR